jgi:hypothetical protein
MTELDTNKALQYTFHWRLPEIDRQRLARRSAALLWKVDHEGGAAHP